MGATMTRRRVLLVIGLFIVGVVLVWLPYRIHLANYATDLRFVILSIVIPLCLFTAAVFIALSARERVREFSQPVFPTWGYVDRIVRKIVDVVPVNVAALRPSPMGNSRLRRGRR
jgi:hypothetical protein